MGKPKKHYQSHEPTHLPGWMPEKRRKERDGRQEEAEASSKDEAGQALDATAEMADVTIDNDGTLEELERKLEEVWSDLSRTQ